MLKKVKKFKMAKIVIVNLTLMPNNIITTNNGIMLMPGYNTYLEQVIKMFNIKEIDFDNI